MQRKTVRLNAVPIVSSYKLSDDLTTYKGLILSKEDYAWLDYASKMAGGNLPNIPDDNTPDTPDNPQNPPADTPPPDPPKEPPVPDGKDPPTEPPIEIEIDPDLDADINSKNKK